MPGQGHGLIRVSAMPGQGHVVWAEVGGRRQPSQPLQLVKNMLNVPTGVTGGPLKKFIM